jgi:hypothetical protein
VGLIDDSSAEIATRLGGPNTVEICSVIPSRDKKFFSLLGSIQTGSSAALVFYHMGTRGGGVSFPESEVTSPEEDQLSL